MFYSGESLLHCVADLGHCKKPRIQGIVWLDEK